MIRLLFPLLASIALPTDINAEISDDLYKKYLEARDYAECVKFNENV